MGTSVDKRLAKRHKRKVARAKERVRVSEPDVRTPDEIKAAREASRPAQDSSGSTVKNPALSFRGGPSHTGGSSKTDSSG